MLKSNVKQLKTTQAESAAPKRREGERSEPDRSEGAAEACRDEGAIGALLRREGLYSSHLTAWRRQREQGELQALAPKKRGRKPTANPLAQENQRLQAEVTRLSRRLQQAELIIDVQKKYELDPRLLVCRHVVRLASRLGYRDGKLDRPTRVVR